MKRSTMYVTLDFETFYSPQYSLTKMSTPEYVGGKQFKIHMAGVKINNGPVAIVNADKIKELVLWLTKIQETSKVHLICHNALFDGYILHHIYNWHPDYYIDTAAMARGLAPHSSAALKNILQRLYPGDSSSQKGTELAASKGIETIDPDTKLWHSLATYCKQDVAMTYNIYKKFAAKLPKKEMDMIHLLTTMFCRPLFHLDMPLLKRYKAHLLKNKEHTIAQAKVDVKILASNPQYAKHIENIGLKPPTKISPATGKITWAFGKADIPYINFQKKHPELEALFAARKEVKSTLGISRVERFINVGNTANNMMPAALKYSAAHTHRLGGGDKTNLQNLERTAPENHIDGDLRPGVLRRALLAPEGMTVLVRDLSNIEARILAVISEQTDLVEIFRKNGDPYAAMAQKIYGRPINKRKDPLERNVGKVAILGLGYGMSGSKFKETLNAGPLGMPPIHLPNETDYDHIVYGVYRKTNTGITSFWKRCDQFIYWMATSDDTEVLEYKCLKVYKERIVLPNGLELQYPELKQGTRGWEYKAKNMYTNIYGGKLAENIVQALAQIVIKEVMLETTRQLPDWRVALQVHDETINIGPLDQADKANNIIAKIMKTPPNWMPELPLNSEGGYAQNYSK